MPVLSADSKHPISLRLNGSDRVGHAEPRMLLSDFLRHDLGATGTHVGCEHGVCGACTIQIDGALARACLTLAVQADGCDVRTIEGLGKPGRLGTLQRSFRKHHALQCGFCTAGILMSLDAHFRAHPDTDEDGIRDLLSGHLCRCTGYTGIVAAALEAAALLRGSASESAGVNDV